MLFDDTGTAKATIAKQQVIDKIHGEVCLELTKKTTDEIKENERQQAQFKKLEEMELMVV